MQITNFKLIDFLNQDPELINQYIVALRYLKPCETERQVFEMKLKHVEYIKQTLEGGNEVDLIKIVAKVQKCTEEQVFDFDIIKFFRIISSIKEQISLITKAEENSLTPSEMNVKWEIVNGPERMSRFGIYNTLESISGGDATKYKHYMNMQYSEVFTILLMRKTANDLQHEMSLIKDKRK